MKRIIKLTTESREYLMKVIGDYIRWNHGTALIQNDGEYSFSPPMEDLLKRLGMLKEMQVKKQ